MVRRDDRGMLVVEQQPCLTWLLWTASVTMARSSRPSSSASSGRIVHSTAIDTSEAYVPIAQVPDQTTIWLANNMYWVVHTDGAPLAVASTVRREIAAVDPAVPASFVRSMDQWMAGTLAPRRFNLQLVAAFAAAALLLATVGVYAVSAAAVAARRREIGIRAALGASRREVIALVLRTGLAPVLAGLATGAAVAVLIGNALGGMLVGVSPGDPFSLGAGVATLAVAAVLANLVPALRAARVDPIAALRVD
jgi:putative ABC transport system permease protein